MANQTPSLRVRASWFLVTHEPAFRLQTACGAKADFVGGGGIMITNSKIGLAAGAGLNICLFGTMAFSQSVVEHRWPSDTEFSGPSLAYASVAKPADPFADTTLKPPPGGLPAECGVNYTLTPYAGYLNPGGGIAMTAFATCLPRRGGHQRQRRPQPRLCASRIRSRQLAAATGFSQRGGHCGSANGTRGRERMRDSWTHSHAGRGLCSLGCYSDSTKSVNFGVNFRTSVARQFEQRGAAVHGHACQRPSSGPSAP